MSDSPESSPSFTAITDFMDGRGYLYSSDPEKQRIGFTMGSKEADYRFSIRITHGGDYLQFVAYCPFRVKQELRASVAELITRANYGMLIGKFEMDMSDGEVRFHISHLIDGILLSPDTVGRLYRSCLYTLDRYLPAFMQHIHAGYTPEDAVFHAELEFHADAVKETPKPGPKAKHSPSSPSHSTPAPSDTSSRASPFGSRPDSPSGPSPKRPRKPARKKNGGEASGQGELPI